MNPLDQIGKFVQSKLDDFRNTVMQRTIQPIQQGIQNFGMQNPQMSQNIINTANNIGNFASKIPSAIQNTYQKIQPFTPFTPPTPVSPQQFYQNRQQNMNNLTQIPTQAVQGAKNFYQGLTEPVDQYNSPLADKSVAYQSGKYFGAGAPGLPQLVTTGGRLVSSVPKIVNEVSTMGKMMPVWNRMQDDMTQSGNKLTQDLIKQGKDPEMASQAGDAYKTAFGMTFGGVGSPPEAAKPYRADIHPEDYNVMKNFSATVDQLGTKANRADLGPLGQDASRVVERYFGKKWATLPNTKIQQLFDYVLAKADNAASGGEPGGIVVQPKGVSIPVGFSSQKTEGLAQQALKGEPVAAQTPEGPVLTEAGKKKVANLLYDTNPSAKMKDPFIQGLEKDKNNPLKGWGAGDKKIPPDGQFTGSQSDQMAGMAQQQAVENKGAFNKIFSKLVGQSDVAGTTGMETAAKFKDIPQDLAEEVIRYRENPNAKVSPEAKIWANKLGQEYDRLFNYAKDNNVDMNYLQNYVTHIWKESIPDVQAKYKAFKQRFNFANERSVPTYKEGVKMGLTPMYDHPAQILQHYTTNLEKVITNNRAFQELKDNGMVVPTSVGVGRQGFEPVNAPGFPRSVSGGKDGKTFIGSWYAPTEIAKTLNHYFSPQESVQALRVGRKISGVMQDVSLSGGIPKTPVNAFSLANIQKEILAGRISSPVSSLIRSISGASSKQYFLDNIETVKKMQARNIPLQTELDVGNMIDRGVIKNSFGKNISEAWNKAVNDPTFKRFMPMLQVNLFKDVEQQALKAGKNPGEAADIAAQSVKNFYGVIGSDKAAMQSPLRKDFVGSVFFAPKFRESMINFWVNNVKALKNPLALENQANTKFIIGSILAYAGYDALNLRLNGRHMVQNPPGTEDKLLIPMGNGQVIGVPFLSSIATIPRGIIRQGLMALRGDVSGAVKDAGQTYLSMPIKPFADVAANSDYFGKPIVQDNMNTGQKFQTMAKYLRTQFLSHPYIKEIFDSRNQTDPAYQRLSRAMELPLRFYTDKSLESKYYYGARDNAVKGLTSQEQQALGAVPKSDSNDPNTTILKYQIYLTYPNVFKAKQQTELEMAQKTGKPIDPLYLVDYSTAQKYMRYETLPPGSQDRKDLARANPELTALFDVRGKYFSENPIPGQAQSNRPMPSDYVQKQMDAKNWSDPQVKAYLDANTAYNNDQRAKLGLTPLASGGSTYRRRSYAKAIKKVKMAKIKIPKSKKVRLKAVSVKFPKAKLAKIKIPKIKTSVG